MTEQEKRTARIAEERFRWWQLAETYWRCVGIAHDAWDTALRDAEEEQEQLAVEMRDRTAKGLRATGKEYEIDRGVEVQLLTPHAKLQFLKECSVTLFIEACKKSLPVTPEGKRAAQKTDSPGDTVEAGSGVDETLDPEAQELDAAGLRVPEGQAPIDYAPGQVVVSEAPAS